MRFFGFVTLLLSIIVSCNKTDDTYKKLKQIDALLYEESDSIAYSLLNSIETEELNTPEKVNYYNLLKTGLRYRMGDRKQTDSLINTCIKFYEKIGDSEKLALSYYYRALVNNHSHNDTVFLDLKQAETLSESIQNYGLMAKIYSAITNVVGRSEEFQLALKYSEKEINAAKKSEKEGLIIYAYINASITYKMLGEQDSALYYARLSEKYVHNISSHYRAYVYNNLGSLIVGINDSLAVVYLNKSLECEPLPQTYAALARIYNAQDNQQAANDMWDNAASRAWPELEAEIMGAKAALEYENGNLYECISTLKDREKALSEFYESKLQSKVLELERKYDIDLYHQKVRSRNVITLMSVILIVAILVLMHRIRIRKIENHKKEIELNYEKSKSTLSMLESRISVLNSDKKSKARELSVLKEKAGSLKAQMQINLQHGHDLYDKLKNCESAINWSDFDILCLLDFVNTTNQEFVIYIEANYNRLNNSQKLFLVADELLGKTDNEICQIFGLEKQSLRNKRNRIRKKNIA